MAGLFPAISNLDLFLSDLKLFQIRFSGTTRWS